MARVESVLRLLRLLQVMDLRKGVSDRVATNLERAIEAAIKEVESPYRLPDDDPLRFDKNGNRLSREALDDKLEDIISSWTEPRGRGNARKTNHHGGSQRTDKAW